MMQSRLTRMPTLVRMGERPLNRSPSSETGSNGERGGGHAPDGVGGHGESRSLRGSMMDSHGQSVCPDLIAEYDSMDKNHEWRARPVHSLL